MRLTIIKPDNMVGIDSEFYKVNLDYLPADIHAVQWDGEYGHIEKVDKPTEFIGSIKQFDSVVPLWEKAKADHLAMIAELKVNK